MAPASEISSVNAEMIELLMQRREKFNREIDAAIRALGGPVKPAPGIDATWAASVQSDEFVGLKPVNALEQVLIKAGSPLTYDEAIALLERGGLRTDKRVLSIGVAQGGSGGRRFYVSDGKIHLAAWRERKSA